MKIIPYDRIAKPSHFGYRGWFGYNPNIEIVDSLDKSDYIWYCAWGDSEELSEDIRRIEEDYDKKCIFVIQSDWSYVPVTGKGFYFTTNINTVSDCYQLEIPYTYHSSMHWMLAGGIQRGIRKWHASFQGSFHTNHNRKKLVQLASDRIYIKECDGWDAAKREEWHVLEEHSELIRDSAFTLCPRGHGPSSIRVCEAIFRHSIPVLLDDHSRLFGNPLSFCVRSTLELDDISYIKVAIDLAMSEFQERHKEMDQFLNDYLLEDYHCGCNGTLGFTERIRREVTK